MAATSPVKSLAEEQTTRERESARERERALGGEASGNQRFQRKNLLFFFFGSQKLGKSRKPQLLFKEILSSPSTSPPAQNFTTADGSSQFPPAWHMAASCHTHVILLPHPVSIHLPVCGLHPQSSFRSPPLLTPPGLPCRSQPSHRSLLDERGASSLVSPLPPVSLFSLFSTRQLEGAFEKVG